MNKQLLSSDYKKWLLYSFGNQNFDTHYNLVKALEVVDTVQTVKVTKSIIQDQVHYTIALDTVPDELLITEVQRNEFLKYLKDDYFRTDDIDGAMLEKSRQTDIGKNHNYVKGQDRTYMDDSAEVAVQPHPKETAYFNIKLGISILFYLFVAALIVYGAVYNMPMLISMALTIPAILFFLLLGKIAKGIFVGIVRGSSIRITKDQFPEIYDTIESQAKKLKVDLPEIYITSGHFNAFVTMFSRGHILMIYSEVVETALKGNFDVLKYVTAHELCHIKQRHLSKEKYLFPSRIVPFLSLAYSRGCEYTCDRIGYHFSPKGSIEGILIMTTGKEIYGKFNIELHIKNSIQHEGFWTWLSEKFLTHPHLYKRIIAIKEYSSYK